MKEQNVLTVKVLGIQFVMYVEANSELGMVRLPYMYNFILL